MRELRTKFSRRPGDPRASRPPARVPRLAGTLLASWVALAGCAVGPNYETPDFPVPDQWESAAAMDVQGEAPPILDWWSAFGDPVLDSLMIRGRDANRDLRIAVARVAEARAFRSVAGGDTWPQVGASGDFTRADGPTVPGGPSNSWSGAVGATWEVDLFGRVRRSREAADAGFHAAVEDYRDVQVSLLAEIASSYANIRSLQLRIALAEANIDAQRETLGIVTARHEAGLVPMLDVTRARSNLANTEAGLPLLRSSLAVERNALSVLLGQPPGEAGLRLGDYRDMPVQADSLVAVIPADLLRRRPDIRSAERRLAAQTARVGVATAELYPRFSLGGVLSVLSGDIDDLFTDDAFGWSFTPGFSWRLFEGGRLRGQIRVEEARVEQALAFYEKSILQALAEVESAIVNLREQSFRRERLRVAADAAAESVELVRTQYIEGLTDFQAYLDAQRVLTDQQDQWAQARGEVSRAVVALNRALGGGWSLEDTDPDLSPGADAVPQGDDR